MSAPERMSSKPSERESDESLKLFTDTTDSDVRSIEDNNLSSNMESAPLMEPTSTSFFSSKHCSGRVCTLKSVLKWLYTNLLLLLTIASVIIGAIIGISVREVNLEKDSKDYYLMVELLGFPGEIFLRMLKMLILPLIVFSLIAGLGSLETKVAGSLGWKTVAYYMTTTVMAVILGLILVSAIRPGGRGVEQDCDNSTHHSVGNNLDLIDSILDLIRNMLPDNLFTATFRQSETEYAVENVTDFNACLSFHGYTRENITYSLASELANQSSEYVSCAQIQDFLHDMNLTCENSTDIDRRYVSLGSREGMNILGIIVFTIAFGVTLGQLGPEGRKIVHAIGILNNAIMKLVTLVMWYSPIGIASIIAGKLAEVEDFSVLVQEIGLYFVTVLTGVLVHGCIVLPLIYTLMTRSNPLKLIRAILQALLTAFGTSSSSATLPITIQNLEDNFHADPRVTRFMLPVGATINMDGTALYEAVAAVFIAQVQKVPMDIPKLIIISITATCASIGAAGVPQAGLFTLVIVLVAVGLNPDDVALILAVDWLLDRFRTTVNVLGDSFGVGIVQHYSKKQLSKIPLTTGMSSAGSGSTTGRAGLDPDIHVAPPITEPHRSGEPSLRSDYGTASPLLLRFPSSPHPSGQSRLSSRARMASWRVIKLKQKDLSDPQRSSKRKQTYE